MDQCMTCLPHFFVDRLLLFDWLVIGWLIFILIFSPPTYFFDQIINPHDQRYQDSYAHQDQNTNYEQFVNTILCVHGNNLENKYS